MDSSSGFSDGASTSRSEPKDNPCIDEHEKPIHRLDVRISSRPSLNGVVYSNLHCKCLGCVGSTRTHLIHIRELPKSITTIKFQFIDYHYERMIFSDCSENAMEKFHTWLENQAIALRFLSERTGRMIRLGIRNQRNRIPVRTRYPKGLTLQFIERHGTPDSIIRLKDNQLQVHWSENLYMNEPNPLYAEPFFFQNGLELITGIVPLAGTQNRQNSYNITTEVESSGTREFQRTIKLDEQGLYEVFAVVNGTRSSIFKIATMPETAHVGSIENYVRGQVEKCYLRQNDISTIRETNRSCPCKIDGFEQIGTNSFNTYIIPKENQRKGHLLQEEVIQYLRESKVVLVLREDSTVTLNLETFTNSCIEISFRWKSDSRRSAAQLVNSSNQHSTSQSPLVTNSRREPFLIGCQRISVANPGNSSSVENLPQVSNPQRTNSSANLEQDNIMPQEHTWQRTQNPTEILWHIEVHKHWSDNSTSPCPQTSFFQQRTSQEEENFYSLLHNHGFVALHPVLVEATEFDFQPNKRLRKEPERSPPPLTSDKSVNIANCMSMIGVQVDDQPFTTPKSSGNLNVTVQPTTSSCATALDIQDSEDTQVTDIPKAKKRNIKTKGKRKMSKRKNSIK